MASSLTLQQYVHTLAWTFLAIAACGVGYLVEKYLVMQQWGLITDSLYRMFKNPAELPMRLFGLPHFVVGTLFLFSSRRMKERGQLWILLPRGLPVEAAQSSTIRTRGAAVGADLPQCLVPEEGSCVDD